jgi:hypothetical protein
MISPTLEDFRKDLILLSERLQALREEFRGRGLYSGVNQARRLLSAVGGFFLEGDAMNFIEKSAIPPIRPRPWP